MKLPLSCALAVLLLLPGAAARAEAPEPEPRAVLQALVRSRPAYQGLRSVAVWSPNGSRAVEIEEFREGPNLRIEVRPTADIGPAILLGSRNGWQIYRPEMRQVERAQAGSEALQRRLEQAFRAYAWSVEGEEQVAGRPTLMLEARPTYPGGLRNRFWVDRDHAMVLRREKYDAENRLVFRSTFVSIEYPRDLQDDLFQAPAGQEAAEAPGLPGEEDPDFSPRFPGAPIPGFVHEHGTDMDPSVAGWDGHHSVYSDGLETVSLFQFPGSRPVDIGAASAGISIASCPARLVLGADGNMLSWSDGQRSYLVISALPRDAVAPMVRELAPEQPPSQGLLYYLKRGWRKVLSLVGLG